MPEKKYRLAYFVSHPIQYQAPLLKLISAQKDIELTVYFLTDMSTQEYDDSGFNQKVQWDTPLLDGYDYHFLNSTLKNGDFTLNNPNVSLKSVRHAIDSQAWDAVWMHGYANRALLHVAYSCWRKNIPLLFRGESNLICSSKHIIKRVLTRLFLKKCAAVLAIGRDNTEFYQHYGVPKERIFSVPYAVNNKSFQEIPTPPVSERIDKPDNKQVVLFASKFIARKNPVMLIDAFQALPEHIKNKTQIWFIGNGEQRQAMLERIKEYHLDKSVTLLGFKNQSELAWYYAQCDVFVLPSQKEPYGLIINEVMNQAKAIITTNEVGAAQDLIDDSNGWVIEAGSTSALTTALSDALGDSNKTTEMGKQSLRKIDNWSYQQDVDGIRKALIHVSKN